MFYRVREETDTSTTVCATPRHGDSADNNANNDTDDNNEHEDVIDNDGIYTIQLQASININRIKLQMLDIEWDTDNCQI